LESYTKLQEEGGFKWKLRYKDKTHNVTFIPFVPLIKGDTKEHDKYCGKYLSCGRGVKTFVGTVSAPMPRLTIPKPVTGIRHQRGCRILWTTMMLKA
jgi:hypothetical protein